MALCEHCNGQFHSRKRVEEEAKAELMAQSDVHHCQRRDISDGIPTSLFPPDIEE